MARNIEEKCGEGVCFIMDGLDEYQYTTRTTSVIYGIIHQKYLNEAMVIVASRPVATADFRNEDIITKRIEVIGFSSDQIFEYIDAFPFKIHTNECIMRSKMISYLESHLSVLRMCYLPVHAAMVCYLFQHLEGNFPSTQTKIYEEFTRCILLRKLIRTSNKAQLRSLHDIPESDKEYFYILCHLAFDMTKTSKHVVLQKDIGMTLCPLDCANILDSPSLGLVIIDQSAQLFGLERVYAFLHQSLQEYLAAFYIASLDVEEQGEIIKAYKSRNQMRMVWQFYFGMVQFSDRLSQLEQLVHTAAVQESDFCWSSKFLIQCEFESQQMMLC